MVRQFGWSLKQIEETDMESLLRFVDYYPSWNEKNRTGGGEGRQRLYADQVSI